MRKTSQDGGDSSSITSGVENEFKKSGIAITKSKGNSIKRKVQNFTRDCDDAVVEPLLKKDNEKKDDTTQSAKYLLTKIKTDSANEKESDREKLLTDKTVPSTPESTVSPVNEHLNTKSFTTLNSTSTAPIHNYMKTNVFNNHLNTKGIVVPKTQILVEIDRNKPLVYSPSPLIFTTAKIHADGKTKHMEPVQMTSVPILSTTEESVVKITCGPTNENKNNGSAGKSIDNTISALPNNKISREKEDQNISLVPIHSITPLPLSKDYKVTSCEDKPNNILVKTTILNTISAKDSMHPFMATVQVPTNNVKNKMAIKNNKKSKDESVINISQSLPVCSNPDNIKTNIPANAAKTIDSALDNIVKTSYKAQDLTNPHFDGIKGLKNNIDLNKNVQADSGSKDVQQSSNNIKISVYTKSDKEKENPSKIISSSIGHKQLQRQKNATIEDIGVLGLKSTDSNVGSTTFSDINSLKASSSTSKDMAQSKIPDYELSNVYDNKSSLFKPSANNVIVTTKTNPEITVPTTTSLNSMPANKSSLTNATSPNTVPVPIVKAIKPLSTNTPLTTLKTKSSTTFKPPMNATTSASTSASEAITSSNKSLTSTMKSSPATSTILTKLSTVSTMKSSECNLTAPINVAVKKSTTSIKPVTTKPSSLGKIAMSSTSDSSVSTKSVKQPANKSDSAPMTSDKLPGGLIPTTTTTDFTVAAGKPSLLNKNSETKTCKLNNNDKSLKA